MKKFDAIIIGSGQAGTPLAFYLAGKGKKIAFIEKEHLGGTCVNVGCTPTKAYVASARRMWDTTQGDALGVKIPKGSVLDLKKVKRRKDALIKESVSGIKKGIEGEKNITFFKGEASFSGPKTLTVNKQELTAKTIYINVGARPFIPDAFKEVPHLTNQSILELEELPDHLVIVGGSYIGLEFGQMFKRFGSKVTIIEKEKAIISKEDTDVSEAIREILEKEKIQFRFNANCISGKKNRDGSITANVDCTKGSPSIKGSHLLLAVGRIPNTDTLNLKAAGVKTDKRGYITVNDYLKTNVSGVYALGDCNGEGAFTHTAYNDYEIIAANIQKAKSRKVTDRILTYGLYIDPPLGRAGLTKKEAKDKGFEVLEAYRPMDKIARAKEKGETKGFMRVLVDKKTDKIVGASILGVGGDEIVTGILNIMYADVPYTVIRDSVVAHPTVSELIPTMLENLNKV